MYSQKSSIKVFTIKLPECYIVLYAGILLIFIFSAKPSLADNLSGDDRHESDSRIGLSAVYSPNSFSAWGKIRNSTAYTLKGQFWFSDFQFRNLHARVGSEIIFTQFLSYPINGIDGPRDERFGFGLVPAKFLVPFGSSAVKPFGFFSAGILFLNDKLPAGDGATLNYLLNLGAGLEISISKNTSLQIGYHLQHLSNANSAGQNPGIDFHNFFFTIVL